jgi:small subunit ribosomal protein S10
MLKKEFILKIKLKSIDKISLNLYINFLKEKIKLYNKQYSIFNLPKKIKRITLLKSPHVNKKAREQFEIKIYTVIIKIKIDLFKLKSLLINKPKTVIIKIVK